jgi:uncharacterized LabA/DUF88 family protein
MVQERDNTYAFIDSQNLNLGILDCGWKLDFARFRVYLGDKYKVQKAFLFIGYVAGNEGLYTYLQQAGYVVIFKPVLDSRDKGIQPKGNVDAELVLHTMIEYENYDKAIIISGDGDFYCLAEYLEEQEKLGYILIPNRQKYSALLRKFLHHIVYLDNLGGKLSVSKKQKKGITLRTKP